MNAHVPIVSLHVIVAVVGIGPFGPIPIVALSARRARFTPPLKTRLFDPPFRTARWSLVAIARLRPKLAQRHSAAGFEALWRAMAHGQDARTRKGAMLHRKYEHVRTHCRTGFSVDAVRWDGPRGKRGGLQGPHRHRKATHEEQEPLSTRAAGTGGRRAVREGR